jgi:hypothetical protein
MIVELYGPPGSGKSTFARALANRLNAHGHDAKVVLPISQGPFGSASLHTSLGSLRAIARVLAAGCSAVEVMLSSQDAHELQLANAIVKTMPQPGWSRRLRLWQYVLRLAFSWKNAADSPGIKIFDQGFIQVLASLSVMRGSADAEVIAKVMGLLPTSNIAIRVVVSRAHNKERLRNRAAHEGMVGQLLGAPVELFFEADEWVLPETIGLFNYLSSLRERCGLSTISVDLSDIAALNEAIDRAEEIISRSPIPESTRTPSLYPAPDAPPLGQRLP